ncbi:MAG TPA: glycosyltransferase family 2 protein [Caulobacteraceae bacterium]|nr:glycosyltransferase family 2 protein [Caulobacteraceae bacterium]
MRLAVIVPCYNEEAAIADVVRGFQRHLPEAPIYVYDNNSTDKTQEVARAAGAIVRREPLRGKGNVLRRMFADVEADAYILVDGDATYDPTIARAMVELLQSENLDMVVAARDAVDAKAAYRSGHQLGNRVLTGAVAWLFGDRFDDMLSGYRVFSRRFVRSFPALATGFETETELTVHALTLRMPIAEVRAPYFDRPAGSVSKLKTYRDGVRILVTIGNLLRRERPVLFFGTLGGVLALLAVILSVPLFKTYMETGLVPRFPTAILAAAMMILAVLLMTVGLILENVAIARREAKRLAYLQYESPGETARRDGVSGQAAA